MLGAFLGVPEQLGRQPLVVAFDRPPRARAGDRPDRHLAVLDAHHHLGRGAGERMVAEVEEEHVR